MIEYYSSVSKLVLLIITSSVLILFGLGVTLYGHNRTTKVTISKGCNHWTMIEVGRSDTPLCEVKGKVVHQREYEIGGRHNYPAIKIILSKFTIDSKRVTINQYCSSKCVSTEQCSKTEYCIKKDNHSGPMIGIQFKDAQEYCSSLGKSLPTASQWEVAAQLHGEEIDMPNKRIAEMTLDLYDTDYYWYPEMQRAYPYPRDPCGPSLFNLALRSDQVKPRTYKGGDPFTVKSREFRGKFLENEKLVWLGFRCVKNTRADYCDLTD